jgi:biopolymer transport protein ExbB
MLGILLQSNHLAANASDTLQNMNTGIQTGELAAAAPSEVSFSLLSMVAKGGVMMIPLAILLLVSIYVLVERLLVLNKASRRSNELMPGIKDLVLKGNVDAARAMCRNLDTPEGRMIEKGISRIGQPMAEIRESMTEAASVELNSLEKNLSVLNITGRIAPMFGFVGTIIGVIKIFYDISLAKTVEIEVISSGLYQKMITSAGGLVVGVLAFIAYHWLNARIDKIAHRMEESKMRLLDILNEPSR